MGSWGKPLPFEKLDSSDENVVEAARDVLRRNYHPTRHTVGAAVLCGSGKVYTGVDVEATGYGPCAEPIAIGAAISNGEREILAIVAVGKQGEEYPVLSPCGNCRQLLLDYAPDATVIVSLDGQPVKARARDLLPAAYVSGFDDESD